MSVDGIFWIFFGLYTTSFFLDIYVSMRQYRLHRRTMRRPDHVAKIVSEEEFAQARAYSLDNFHFHFVSKIIKWTITSTVHLLNGLPWIWNVSGVVTRFIWPGSGENFQSIAFIGLLSIVYSVASLPFALYNTFVIEERHGFNRQSLRFFLSEYANVRVFIFVLSAPFIPALNWIIQNGGLYFFVYVWCFLFISKFLLLIVPLSDQFKPLPLSNLRTNLEALMKSVGFPNQRLYVEQESKRTLHSTAYTSGFWMNKQIVVSDTLLSAEINRLLAAEKTTEKKKTVGENKKHTDKNNCQQKQKDEKEGGKQKGPSTDGNVNQLATTSSSSVADVEKGETKEEKKPAKDNFSKDKDGKMEGRRHPGLSDDEVIAVIGHELGHWSHLHSLWSFLIQEADLLLKWTVFAQCHRIPSLYAAFGFPPVSDSVHPPPVIIGLAIIFPVVMAPYNKLKRVAINCWGRRQEFAADQFAAGLGLCAQLKQALVKIHSANLSLPIDDWLYSIVNNDHPPIPERLEALEKHRLKKEDAEKN